MSKRKDNSFMAQRIHYISSATGLAVLLAGCATVKLEAPDKPIEINLNVNITQELRVKVDKDVDDLIASNPDIF